MLVKFPHLKYKWESIHLPYALPSHKPALPRSSYSDDKMINTPLSVIRYEGLRRATKAFALHFSSINFITGTSKYLYKKEANETDKTNATAISAIPSGKLNFLPAVRFKK